MNIEIKAQFKHRVGPLVFFDCNLLIKFLLGFLYWLLFKVAHVLLKDPLSKGYLVNLSYSIRFKRKQRPGPSGNLFGLYLFFLTD